MRELNNLLAKVNAAEDPTAHPRESLGGSAAAAAPAAQGMLVTLPGARTPQASSYVDNEL